MAIKKQFNWRKPTGLFFNFSASVITNLYANIMWYFKILMCYTEKKETFLEYFIRTKWWHIKCKTMYLAYFQDQILFSINSV